MVAVTHGFARQQQQRSRALAEWRRSRGRACARKKQRPFETKPSPRKARLPARAAAKKRPFQVLSTLGSLSSLRRQGARRRGL